MSADDRLIELQKEKFDRALAEVLNLTYNELCQLDYYIEDYTGHDDQVFHKIIRFREDIDKYRDQIPYLDGDQVWLDLEIWYRLLASTGNSDD